MSTFTPCPQALQDFAKFRTGVARFQDQRRVRRAAEESQGGILMTIIRRRRALKGALVATADAVATATVA
ncbi:hypothetical protein ACFV0D_37115, partial [Streptomyces sp. NPDC059556]|uniref:hypothetical protein n=1 Tax=Streptomyces sp. NPDC059556 TaxID=3346863 RepID=UPI003686DD01